MNYPTYDQADTTQILPGLGRNQVHVTYGVSVERELDVMGRCVDALAELATDERSMRRALTYLCSRFDPES